MEEKRKNKINILTIVFAIVAVASIGVNVFQFIANGDETNCIESEQVLTNNVQDNNSQKENELSETNDQDLIYNIESNKSLNTKDYTYSLNDGDIGITLTLGTDKKTINGIASWSYAKNYLGIQSAKDTIEKFNLTFDQEVLDIFFGECGQDVSGGYVFFLMKDKTIEYMSIYKAFSTGNFNSNGKVANVESIVRLAQTAAVPTTAEVGGYATVIAIKEDGSFYDLGAILNK